MSEDTAIQTQDDEKLALQSIFGEDALFAKNIWKVWMPLNVTIHLEPLKTASQLETKEVFVFIDLRVECSRTYPHSVPVISFVNTKGIPQDDLKILLNRLSSRCTELLGSPMILELCEEIRQFLYEKNEPPKGSFHDTMLKKKAMVEIEMKRQRANSEKYELEMVAEEKKRLIQQAQWKRDAENEEKAVGRITSFGKDGDPRIIGGECVIVLNNIPRKRRQLNTYCKEWMGYFKEEYVLVSEWTFYYSYRSSLAQSKRFNYNLDLFLRKCNELESFYRPLTTLSSLDQTLIPYSFITVENSSTSSNLDVKIYVAQKVPPKEENILSLLCIIKQDAGMVRRLAAQMVCALRWLHDQQMTHGSLSLDSVWISKNAFRISDFVVLRGLLDLSELFHQVTSEKLNTTHQEKISRKKDIVCLGTILDNFVFKSSSELTVLSEYHDQLIDFIRACRTVKNIEELIDHRYLIQDLTISGSGYSNVLHKADTFMRSRLTNEFFVMKWLGKGGFGDVILARNKLDGNDYAVKRIPLNPKSERLNRRITREAKLFSKLNHPHVVRYYSAWIEDTPVTNEDIRENVSSSFLEKSSLQSAVSDGESILPTRIRNIEAMLINSTVGTSEWSTSYKVKDNQSSLVNSDDDDDYLPVRTLFSPTDNIIDDEFGIYFETSSSKDDMYENGDKLLDQPKLDQCFTADPYQGKETGDVCGTDKNFHLPSRLLYIQMEYCERSTLRARIDSTNLIGNSRMIWRMFSEILSGLQYIHQQGMIHRDIKPMNILLDSIDRVKIGDFGLATHDLMLKRHVGNASNQEISQTRDIGTELYMAPELFVIDDNKPYTAKIDVYSTGIVLFEMFYNPLPPGMERISTIRNLKKEREFPHDFGCNFTDIQGKLARKLIEWMLQSNAEERPSVDDLLSSDHLPLSDAGDEDFQNTFLKTIKKRSGHLYNWIMESICKEEPSKALIYCFDQEICKEKFVSSRDRDIEALRQSLSSILRLHSFEPVQTHLLVPSTSARQAAGGTRTRPAQMFDSAGFPLSLPIDLRQNFVRYCARNAVYRLKRYAVDRVFSSAEAIGGVHPLERWEFSVDCIGPFTSAVTLSAEMLTIISEISSKILKGMKTTLRIGHIGIIDAAMKHLSISESYRQHVLQALHNISTSHKRLGISERVDELSESVGVRIASSLLSVLPTESSLSFFKEKCKALTCSKDEKVKENITQAIFDIERVFKIFSPSLCNGYLEIIFDASLVYRPLTFMDGLVFQMATEAPFKKGSASKSMFVLAGGRYDSLLLRERHTQDLTPPMPLCLIGCSISLDMLAHLRKLSSTEGGICTVLICSYSNELLMEKFNLANILWKKNVSTDILHDPVDSFDQLIEHCSKKAIRHLLVVFNRDEVLVRSDGIDHGKITFDKAVALLTNESENEEVATTIMIPQRSSLLSTSVVTATFSNCNISFALADRISFSIKKRLENQVKAILPDLVSLFSTKVRIEIIVTELTTDLIKMVAGSICRSSTKSEITSLFDVLGRQHGKSKKDLECLYSCLLQSYTRNGTIPLFVLFRHLDGFYRMII